MKREHIKDLLDNLTLADMLQIQDLWKQAEDYRDAVMQKEHAKRAALNLEYMRSPKKVPWYIRLFRQKAGK